MAVLKNLNARGVNLIRERGKEKTEVDEEVKPIKIRNESDVHENLARQIVLVHESL